MGVIEALERGELDEARAAQLRAHLEGCAACRRDRDWLRAERAFARNRPARDPGHDALWNKIELQLEPKPPQPSWWRTWLWLPTGVSLAAATVMLVLWTSHTPPMIARPAMPLDAAVKGPRHAKRHRVVHARSLVRAQLAMFDGTDGEFAGRHPSAFVLEDEFPSDD